MSNRTEHAESKTLDVWENKDGAWVIAHSAAEAREIFRAKQTRGNLQFSRAEGPFDMYFEDAHEDERCPMEGPVETASDSCAKCSPIFTRDELIAKFADTQVIYEYQ